VCCKIGIYKWHAGLEDLEWIQNDHGENVVKQQSCWFLNVDDSKSLVPTLWPQK